MKTKKKTKKKGRPSLLDLRMRNLNNNNNNNNNNSTPNSNLSPNSGLRSGRRNHNSDVSHSDSDSDEREQKKVKLVVRLPTSNSDEIDASGDRSHAAVDQLVVKDEKATEALQGSPFDSGPTAALPDKKLLVFILDRLQKKDTYGVFSEPVDPNELPDYHEIIEHPMDFGTVRKKLDEGSYSNLDDFESDVLLICANAMQYNASDSVYHRQAKSIQDIAKRDFHNLRQVNDEGEPQPRIVKRGRPPNLKKALGSPPLHLGMERVGPESSSDATLATGGGGGGGDNTNNDNNNNSVGPSSYNLRKPVPSSFRFQPTDSFFKASPQPRNYETHTDYTTDWNSEFPAKILKAEAKYGKKQFVSDENRRVTYKQFHPSAFGHDTSSLTTLNGNMKQLIGVGLYSEHGYARSLARFAANLGPVVWKIASKKIEKALPDGVKFGPGWVGENDVLPTQAQPPSMSTASTNSVHDSNNNISHHHHPTTASPETIPGQIPYNEHFVLRNNDSRMGPMLDDDNQQKQLLSIRNGFSHPSSGGGYDFSNQADMLRARLLQLPTEGGGGQQSGAPPHQTPPFYSTPDPNTSLASSSKNPQNISISEAASSQQQQQQHQQQKRPYNGGVIGGVPPDLNVRFQSPASPSSSFRIGGSAQPDLALQL